MFLKALRIASKAHAGQVDKGGNPYIYHPLAIMREMKSTSTKMVALLHDVLEDSDITLDELRSSGIPEDVLDALTAITRRGGESSQAYLRRVSQNPMATEVKLADLRHNLDTTRLKEITEQDQKRCRIYEERIRYLERRRDRIEPKPQEKPNI